ncbi:HEAT repeat domain-containing protein [Chloroflexi bacterium TSY]|nr:HEAT repeat domain-containing protein [Chloroflexi bacterium TSY]
MQQFIREGYIILKPDMPDSYHRSIYQKIEETIEQKGNPRNNLLPAVHELMELFEHPVVHGAMSSILGPDYFLNFHRHVHDRPPGGADQKMHKDSLHNSRFAVDNKTRHHHTRWTMLFYYPQDTPVQLGPTAIVPKSQYLNIDWPEGERDTPLDGDAGTVVIVHYDLLHRGMANHHDSTTRQMIKFLFTRMSEPTEPTWDYAGSDWTTSAHPQENIWRHMWNWHQGNPKPLTRTSETSVDELIAQLGSEKDIEGLQASYELGTRGEEALPALLQTLQAEDAAATRNAVYAFNQIGEAAIPALVEASQSDNERLRARSFDILGDMGQQATSASATLRNGLADPEEDPRRRAAEALGTVSQNDPSVAASLAQLVENDPSGMVRRNAALSLARLGPNAREAVPALAKGMSDPNHYVRGYSVHALARIGTPEASQAALRQLEVLRYDRE